MSGKNGKYQKLKSIFNSMDGIDLHETRNGRFHFQVFLSQKMQETDIEGLELSVRSYNCLKRAGYETIGQLAEDIAGGIDVRRIRNCGAKSAEEIMENLFLWNLRNIPLTKQERYLQEVIKQNA